MGLFRVAGRGDGAGFFGEVLMDTQEKAAVGKRYFYLGLSLGILTLFGLLAFIINNSMKIHGHSKQSEAKHNLGAIYTAQVAYFGEYGTYASSGIIDGQHTNAFQLINWEPLGQNRYAYYCDTGAIASKPESNECNLLPHLITSSREGFTACAVANIDTDDFCDVWCVNDDKILRNQYAGEEDWGADANDINFE